IKNVSQYRNYSNNIQHHTIQLKANPKYYCKIIFLVQILYLMNPLEGSCSRCTLPFSVVLLIIGVALTAVAYSCSTHGSTISILGLLLLTSGLLLLGFSAICRRCRKRRKMDKAWESQTDLVESLRNSFD
uniref:Transmembrane protein 100 n=1 Tax=Sinocyclocheilus anshuiensis TaxID=1608454 RepID=A0A671NK34_9TELE